LKDFPDLTDRELAFRAMLQNPAKLAAWCERARHRWERRRGIEWFHGYRHGREIWKTVRPPPDENSSPRFRENAEVAAQYRAAEAAAKAERLAPPSATTTRTGTHPARTG
jgi:hypothetical protein